MLCFLGVSRLSADEGMWTFDAPPLERLRRDHGFEPTAEWLTHLQQSSIRFSSGGSGAFVSADGLVLTNHHVAAGALQKLGDATHDYSNDGFLAASRADEIRCPDIELNVLVSIEDVTRRVVTAVRPGMSADEAFAARRAIMAEIEKESLATTGLRSDVVTLHQGGAYHLYRARKYTDVRLVFAPERRIAFFGGDADNFEFPRYDLDICFFRAYENDAPARVAHHLAWSRQPLAAGDLVFVSGHPGHTDRAKTVAELVSMRDRQLPATLATLNRLEVMLGAYADEGPEERRQATADLFGAQNSRKRMRGMLASLLDPDVFAARREEEALLCTELGAEPFDRIAGAQAELDRIAVRLRLLEGGVGFNSRFFANARTILRSAAERAKPNGERLREFRDSNLASLEQQLLSPEPLYDAFEIEKLSDSLTFLATTLGTEDELVARVLAGKTPGERAAELVAGTNCGRRAQPEQAQAPQPDRRRELYDGGAAAVAASRDTMLAVARLVDDEARSLRRAADAADEIKRQAHAEIARARFTRGGAAVYPDATFTLRLAYGTVAGYGDAPGWIDPITTYGGLFERAAAKRNEPPFDLPPRWESRRKELVADAGFAGTAFNFASTADIIGGNSGSPVVNRAGQLVGVIFDGNIESLVLGIRYDGRRARAVAVAATGIIAALEQVYAADVLAGEVLANHRPAP